MDTICESYETTIGMQAVFGGYVLSKENQHLLHLRTDSRVNVLLDVFVGTASEMYLSNLPLIILCSERTMHS